MPLYDHFIEPMATHLPWASIHNLWIAALASSLNQEWLPSGYRALPFVHIGGVAQVDVSTFVDESPIAANAGNGVATLQAWAPPQPPMAASIDFADADRFEVAVYAQPGSYRQAAAIELVSPANKDRPAQRRGFAAKCAALLRENVSVMVVDVIPERRANLHAELTELLQMELPNDNVVNEAIYAIAYRVAGTGTGLRLEAWPGRVAVGESLPLLPLWLAVDLAIPLDLEQSYRQACNSLRLPENQS